MPEFLNRGLHLERAYTGPDGNLSRKMIELDSAHIPLEAFEGANRASLALAAEDLVYLWKLPQGARVFNVGVAVYDGTGAADTIDIGTKQQGEGSWVDDPDYFVDGSSINGATWIDALAGRRIAPLLVNQPDVYLTITFKTAIGAGDTFKMRLYIDYEYVGNL